VPEVQEACVYRAVGEHDPDVPLVDTVNLKRHVVMKDSGNTFATPPENMKTVNVYFGLFVPLCGVLCDVPVEQRSPCGEP
jgi:hypothetical protein